MAAGQMTQDRFLLLPLSHCLVFNPITVFTHTIPAGVQPAATCSALSCRIAFQHPPRLWAGGRVRLWRFDGWKSASDPDEFQRAEDGEVWLVHVLRPCDHCCTSTDSRRQISTTWYTSVMSVNTKLNEEMFNMHKKLMDPLINKRLINNLANILDFQLPWFLLHFLITSAKPEHR